MPRTVQETTPMEIDELSQAANTATNNNDNNGTSTSVSAPRPVANTASLQLQQIKQHFNPEGMLKKSRSSSTFNSNQAENTRLIFYLWTNSPQLLYDDFAHHLYDVDASIDYNDITNPTTKKRYKTSVEQRKQERREKTIRNEISEALGPGGTRPTQRTINFDAFTSDPEIFVKYIQTRVKADGALMRPGVYGGYHTNLNNLFRRYQYRPSEDYKEQLTRYMDGVKNIANQANQAGEVRK